MSKWPLRVSVYGAGEAINGTAQLDTQIRAQLNGLSQVATNRFVAAVAQLDSSNFPSVRYVLDPLGRQPVTSIQNFNAGDPQNLIEFVEWSSQICPAQHSLLVLSGHGAAWEDQIARQVLGTRGLSPGSSDRFFHARNLFGKAVSSSAVLTKMVLIDGGSRDYLSNSELGSALDRISLILGGPLDVLVFDACLMSSWEMLQELSSSVTTVVASVDELSAAGMNLSTPVAVATQQQGQMTAQQLAGAFVQQFRPAASFDSCVAIDLSDKNWVVALDSFKTFCEMFLRWIQASTNNASAARDALRLAATSVVKFWNGGLADISKLTQSVTAITDLPINCVQAIQSAESSLRACVIGKSVGNDYTTALGVSIFTPSSQSNYITNRPDYARLQFSNVTGWGNILDVLYAGQESGTRFIPLTSLARRYNTPML